MVKMELAKEILREENCLGFAIKGIVWGKGMVSKEGAAGNNIQYEWK